VIKNLLITASVVLLLTNKLVAQHPLSDSAVYEVALTHLIQLYKNKPGGYSNLYNGAEYNYTYAGIKGHPYFKTDSFQLSDLSYDDILYRDIPLKYDLVTNEVIIKGKENRLIKLVAEKLDYFSVRRDLFIKIRKDTSSRDAPEPGYYQLLYNGPLTALVSRKKVAIRSLKAEDPYQFASYDQYYVRKRLTYYPINSKNDLISLFDTHNEIVKEYRKIRRARFKRDMEELILKAVSTYAESKN
jgi:hypothetical protein